MQLAARLRDRIHAGEIVSRLSSLAELTSQTGLAVGTVAVLSTSSRESS